MLKKNALKRFYPDSVLYNPYEPSVEKFEILTNNTFGKGVVSKSYYEPGDLLFRFEGEIMDYQTLYTLQKRKDLYIEDKYFMGRILHSCDPNTIVNMENQEFWSIKPIKPGDYVTMDYDSTEDVLYQPFHCKCGTDKCRGYIAGKLKIVTLDT